jgi:hypothetical protein
MAEGVGREFEIPCSRGAQGIFDAKKPSLCEDFFVRRWVKTINPHIRLLFSTMAGAARPSHQSTSIAAAPATEIQKSTTHSFDASD